MPNVFFNEIHYDNASGDVGEFIEIAGPAGTDLTGWSIVLYNGSNGTVYNTIALSGSIDDEGSGYGAIAVSFPPNGLQNGAPDGFALVDNNGTVIQFLSYEGSFTAVGGPADGMTSTDIGVAETGTTPIGESLQLVGSGTDSAAFTWQAPAAESPGTINVGQSFGGPVLPGEISIEDAAVAEGAIGTTEMTLTLTRANGSSGEVSVDYVVTLDTADGADVTGPLSGTVTFADGQTSATITIEVVGDQWIEADETMTVTLSNPQGGVTIVDDTAIATITDDDLPPIDGARPFINEIHYDNDGSDVGEGVEIAGLAGTDLTGWSIVLYNGNGGSPYSTTVLSGVIPNEGNGWGAIAVSYPSNGIQNGAPDGIALVDASGNVVQFLSYEGTMTAVGGPADGMTSTDIGVFESGGTAIGESLQLIGEGSSPGEFSWTFNAAQSFGALNDGQAFAPANPNGSFAITDGIVVEGDAGTTSMVFTVYRTGGTLGEVSVDYDVEFIASAIGADASDLAGVPSGTITLADGVAYQQFTIEIQGDLEAEPGEIFNIVLSNATGGADIADAVGVGTILPDDVIEIGAIQGEGHRSPFEGAAVKTEGVVTAITNNGFYLQDPIGDGNSATSDAIFVFTGNAPTVAVGDAVEVTGDVTEFQPGGSASLSFTEIVNPTVTVISSGNPLPAATLVGPDGISAPSEVIDDDGLTSFDPTTDGIDFWESLEGMLVTLQAPVVVEATNSRGETWVVASDGNGNLDATNVAESGFVVIDGKPAALGTTNSNGFSDFNPERIQIDDTFVSSDAADLGAQLADVTGIIGYNFNDYELLNLAPLNIVEAGGVAPEQSDLFGASNQLSIATYNTLNLDPGDDQAKFDEIAYDLGVALNAPDIIVLQEIQDNDGRINSDVVSADMTLQMLVDAIFAETGIQYSYLDNTFITDDNNGGEPGGNIRVAILYRPDRVEYVEGSLATIEDEAFDGARDPLIANFEFNGEVVTVIGAHLTSKGGSSDLFGGIQPPVNGGADQRAAQASAINAYVAALLATSIDANVVVAGDLNEFQFEEPTLILTGDYDYDGTDATPSADTPELVNLTYVLPANERYSYIFEGNAQQLDHVLATSNLADNADIDVVHVNTTQPDAPSDHDPVLVVLDVGFNVQHGGNGIDLLIGNDGKDKLYGDNGDDVLIGLDGDDILDGGRGDDVLDGGDGNDLLTGGRGDDLFVLDADGDEDDADTVTDFGAKASGDDSFYIVNADGHAIEFVQDGANTLITSDGVVIATIIGADAGEVAMASLYDGTPSSVSSPLADVLVATEADISALFGEAGMGMEMLKFGHGFDMDLGLAPEAHDLSTDMAIALV